MKKTALIALALPIVALLGWCILLERGLSQGEMVRVRITGYDPRDLLSGHFVRYALPLADLSPCLRPSAERAGDQCICLSADSDGVHHVPTWGGNCNDRPQTACEVFIRGVCVGARFDAGIEQYFIPERLAPVLQTIPENSSIILSIRRNGRAQIASLLVEEQPIEEYARARLEAHRHDSTPE